MSADYRRRILLAQEFFSTLGASAVEKDLHVVRAIGALTRVNASPFSLVFGGGTALARAHRVIERMSEDIDFKVVFEDRVDALSGEALKRELSRLRRSVSEALRDAGFHFDEENENHVRARNLGRYTLFQLPYDREFLLDSALRPVIQIELTVSPLLLPSLHLPVSSFVAESFREPPEVARVSCVAVAETAAEKVVALTRRTAMEAVGLERKKDPSVVRHLYDLHYLRTLLNVKEVGGLIKRAMERDVREFGNQFPAYRDDPLNESRKGLAILASDPMHRERFAVFTADMVYGPVPEFSACLATVQELMRDV